MAVNVTGALARDDHIVYGSSYGVVRNYLVVNNNYSSQSFSTALQLLNPPDLHSDYDSLISKQVKGTGEWLLSSALFQQWERGTMPSNVFWVHGIPGSGKTMLCATIIEHLKERVLETDRQVGMGYFFFRASDYARNTRALLASLIHQLWRSLGADRAATEEFSKRYSKAPMSFRDLLSTLLQAVSGFEETYFVIDALDECNIDDQDGLFEVLGQLQNCVGSNVRLAVTSRLNMNIQDFMRRFSAIEVSIAASSDDVRMFVETAMQDTHFSRLRPDLKAQVVETVVRNSDGMFLWATMFMQGLRNFRTIRDLNEGLKRLPRDINTLYEALLDRMEYTELKEAGTRKIAKSALNWLVSSYEPLSRSALAEAAVLDPDSYPIILDENRLFEPADIQRILGDLVVENQHLSQSEPNIQLIHYSLVEFLQIGPRHLYRSSWYAVNPAESNHLLSISCLEYLYYYATSGHATRTPDDTTLFPLLTYASRHWLNHVKKQRQLDSQFEYMPQERLRALVHRLFSTKNLLDAWLLVFDPADPAKAPFEEVRSAASPLFYAVATDSVDIVSGMIDSGADVHMLNAFGRGPLHAAASLGLVEIAMILLDHGASSTTMDLQGQTPLEESVEADQPEMTMLLYDKTDKAVMRQLNHKGASLLHRLAMKPMMTGNVFALFIRPNSSEGERAINNHDDINLKDGDGCTLLHRAVQVGNISVVTALVAEGANINAQGPKGDTPIHFAIRYSQEAVREYLNENGASLSLRNDDEQTPLQLYWDRKSLPWAMYERDPERSASRKMSPGGQAEISVLKRKTLDGPGPEFIFCKTYDFSRIPNSALDEVDRALIRETETLQQLDHPFIVSYRGLQESDESQEVNLYLEYCEGGDLQTMHVQVPSTNSKENPDPDSSDYSGPSSRAARFRMVSQADGPAVTPLSEPEIWELVYQLFAALACLHYGVSLSRDGVCRIEPHWNPVVHRDVKPQNVVLTTQSDGRRIAKLCDLGIARQFLNVNQTDSWKRGTQEYRPPETMNMNLDPRDREWTSKGDIYGLGKTIQNLHKNFTMEGSLRDMIAKCQLEDPKLRPSSLDVLEEAERHVQLSGGAKPFMSLLLPVGKPDRGFSYQAFLEVSKHLDTYHPFLTTTDKTQRKKLIDRLSLLLKDGALATFQEHSLSLHLATLLDDKRLLVRLLDRGQDPDERWQKSSWTALHLAAQQNKPELATMLVDAGADRALRDRHGRRAADYGLQEMLSVKRGPPPKELMKAMMATLT